MNFLEIFGGWDEFSKIKAQNEAKRFDPSEKIAVRLSFARGQPR